MQTFRSIDHTGDLGIEVFGDSPRSLFQHAGEAFTDVITHPETIRLLYLHVNSWFPLAPLGGMRS